MEKQVIANNTLESDILVSNSKESPEKNKEEEIKKILESGKAENYKEAESLFNLEESVLDKSEAAIERMRAASELARNIKTMPFYTDFFEEGHDSLKYNIFSPMELYEKDKRYYPANRFAEGKEKFKLRKINLFY